MSDRDPPLRILKQDDRVVAVHKPAGMFVHRSRETGPQQRFLLQELRDRIGRRVYPVHRLDRATSGVVILALDPAAAGNLAEQFRVRSVSKTYEAIVRGFLPPRTTIKRPLHRRREMKDGRTEVIELPSVTVVETLEQWVLPLANDRYPTTRCSRVRVFPKTGRRHQIRRHLKHAAHPILGDTNHGDHRLNRVLSERIGLQRLLLVATSLSFAHPADGRTETIRTEPDADHVQIVKALVRLATAHANALIRET